jgi:hypothetical protein
MKSINHPARLLCSAFAFALALALALAFNATARAADAYGEKKSKTGNMPAGKMAEQCEEMMKQKKSMAAEMKAQDAALTAQLATMNSAPENEKLALLAAIVTKTTEQRIAMDATHAKMESAMMAHMMEHMQDGKDSMADCPMMKSMDGKSSDKKSDYDGSK